MPSAVFREKMFTWCAVHLSHPCLILQRVPRPDRRGRMELCGQECNSMTYDTCSTPQPPPPGSGKKNPTFRRQRSGETKNPFWPFSGMFRVPRPQTLLLFGCCVVRVIWKPKISVSLKTKFAPLSLYMGLGQWCGRCSHYSIGMCTALVVEGCWFNFHCIQIYHLSSRKLFFHAPLGATKTTLQHLWQWVEEQKCHRQKGREWLAVAASVFTEKD